ncbi:hypothetical protein [Bifidobacterium longum]|uniref:hypothetical protein n=1 Tax=Bifidobacterium longum TaxID=216816 RepID=UPI002073AEF4|nr:hypothetical protein [Bifidobacterium longum]
MKKAMIYVHGKGGSYLEAEQFKNICLDFDVFGVDYNDYLPWIVEDEIMEVYDRISEEYDYIYMYLLIVSELILQCTHYRISRLKKHYSYRLYLIWNNL